MKELKAFDLNGKQVDLSRTFPLTIADIQTLKKQGCDLVKLGAGLELEHLVALTLYMCRKANTEITPEDVATMPFSWLSRIAQIAGQQSEADFPF